MLGYFMTNCLKLIVHLFFVSFTVYAPIISCSHSTEAGNKLCSFEEACKDPSVDHATLLKSVGFTFDYKQKFQKPIYIIYCGTKDKDGELDKYGELLFTAPEIDLGSVGSHDFNRDIYIFDFNKDNLIYYFGAPGLLCSHIFDYLTRYEPLRHIGEQFLGFTISSLPADCLESIKEILPSPPVDWQEYVQRISCRCAASFAIDSFFGYPWGERFIAPKDETVKQLIKYINDLNRDDGYYYRPLDRIVFSNSQSAAYLFAAAGAAFSEYFKRQFIHEQKEFRSECEGYEYKFIDDYLNQVKQLVKNSSYVYSFYKAIASGDIKTVKIILHIDPTIPRGLSDKKGDSVWHIALRNNDKKMLELLWHCASNWADLKDSQGRTFVERALESNGGSTELLEFCFKLALKTEEYERLEQSQVKQVND